MFVKDPLIVPALKEAEASVISIFRERSEAEEAYNSVISEETIGEMLEKQELFFFFRNGEAIGLLSFTHTEASDIRTIGYRLLPAYRGRGIGKEMVREGLKFAREALGLRWLYAYVAEGNEASCRILEGLGFLKKASDPGFLENREGTILVEYLTYVKRLAEEEF